MTNSARFRSRGATIENTAPGSCVAPRRGASRVPNRRNFFVAVLVNRKSGIAKMNDLKFAFRQLLRNPGFTAVAVLTLALGIGPNTVVFSVAKAVLFRPLGFEAPD